MLTTYERGMLQGQRKIALAQLEAKFGRLSADVRHRVEALSPEQLDQLALDLLKSQSFRELHLED